MEETAVADRTRRRRCWHRGWRQGPVCRHIALHNLLGRHRATDDKVSKHLEGANKWSRALACVVSQQNVDVNARVLTSALLDRRLPLIKALPRASVICPRLLVADESTAVIHCERSLEAGILRPLTWWRCFCATRNELSGCNIVELGRRGLHGWVRSGPEWVR